MAAFSLKEKRALLALLRCARFARVRSLYSLLNKFNTDAVRTSSVAQVGVGKGAARLATPSAAPLRVSRIMQPTARLYP